MSKLQSEIFPRLNLPTSIASLNYPKISLFLSHPFPASLTATASLKHFLDQGVVATCNLIEVMFQKGDLHDNNKVIESFKL